jgi:acyl-CoA thioester hydrolase
MFEAQPPGPPRAVHVWPVRVYYEDTDAGGVVYHATYLRFAERGRTEMLRAAGFDHRSLLADHGVQMVVRSCAVEFIAPARLDDALEVHSRIATMGAASVTIRQEIYRLDAGETVGAPLTTADLRLACIDASFRPARLPEALRRALGHIKAI